MKIALFHNYYKQRGGEDGMFELEVAALRAHGHTVVTHTVHNSAAFTQNSLSQKLRGAFDAPHNHSSEATIRKFLSDHRPDISHVHNWFPILSPSIYTAHHDAGVPILQTLHNYRLDCASANHQRNGQSCQACRPGHNLPAIRHRCYNNSVAGSLAWKRVMDRGWKNGTFTNQVSHYISPSLEVQRKHIEMGIPAEKITHIPNACPDPQFETSVSAMQLDRDHQHVCFVGRFVPEKGAHILIRAWQCLQAKHRNNARLILIGSGPQETMLHKLADGDDSIHFTGQLSHDQTLSVLKQADLLVCPSLWAEPFGLSVIEAMGAGIPVISSKLGGPSEIISHGIDGELIPAGDISALSQSLAHSLNDPDQLQKKGHAARLKYTHRYTPDQHAQQLTRCFQCILEPQEVRVIDSSAPTYLPTPALALSPSS